MMRNVIAGQCEAQDSALLLGTRPQAVCFCRDILNRPCTYVNIEHQDACSHHSERCRDVSHPPLPKKNIHSIYLNLTSAVEPI